MSYRASLGGRRWLVISQAMTGGPRGGSVRVAVMEHAAGVPACEPFRIQESAAWTVCECTTQHAGSTPECAAARKVSEVVAVYIDGAPKSSMDIHREALAWIRDHFRDGHKPSRA